LDAGIVSSTKEGLVESGWNLMEPRERFQAVSKDSWLGNVNSPERRRPKKPKDMAAANTRESVSCVLRRRTSLERIVNVMGSLGFSNRARWQREMPRRVLWRRMEECV
jgi:hypothetical protein